MQRTAERRLGCSFLYVILVGLALCFHARVVRIGHFERLRLQRGAQLCNLPLGSGEATPRRFEFFEFRHDARRGHLAEKCPARRCARRLRVALDNQRIAHRSNARRAQLRCFKQARRVIEIASLLLQLAQEVLPATTVRRHALAMGAVERFAARS